MNLFGEIGNFIIDYQEPIQAAVIIAVIIAVILMIIKISNHARKKREILTQINTTVSEINTAVNHLQDKKTEVIYIDSRTTPGTGESSVTELDLDTSGEIPDTAEAEAPQCSAAVSAKPAAESVSEKIEPSLKYFSRDCAVSKTGKQFTYEELDAQIRE